MSIFGKVLDTIGIIEDGSTPEAVPEAKLQAVPVHQPLHQSAPVWTPSPLPFATSTTTEQQKDQHYYPVLLEKTSPSEASTPFLNKVMAMAKPLEGIIPDRITRMRAAVAQAGVTADVVTSEIKKLGDSLKTEGQKFQQELERKKSDISQKQSQATALEQQLHDLRVEISDKNSKIDQAGIEFQSAYSHRETEIQQLQSESSNWR